MTLFHNLCRDHQEITAPPLVCARSGHLHTICSVVTKEKISSLQLRLLSQQYLAKFSHRQDLTALPSHQQHLQLLRPQAHTSSPHQFHQRLQVSRLQIAPVPISVCRSLASAYHTSSISVCRSLASAYHTSSIRIPRSSPNLEYPAWCSSSFHLTSPRSILVPSANCSHLQWKSQIVLLTTPSGSR